MGNGHISFVHYFFHAVLSNPATMGEPILMKVGRSLKSCCVCKSSAPATIKCRTINCTEYLHATCGQKCNSLREEEQGDLIDFRVYCKKHVANHSKPRLSLDKIKEFVVSRKSMANVGGANIEMTEEGRGDNGSSSRLHVQEKCADNEIKKRESVS